MKKHLFFFIMILGLSLVSACDSDKETTFEKLGTGTVDKSNLYKNEDLGLSVQFPKSWVELDKEDYSSALQESENMKPLTVFTSKKISSEDTAVDYVFQILTIKSTISPEDQLYGIKAQAEMMPEFNMTTGDVTEYKLNGKTLYSLESQIAGQGTTTTLIYDAGDYVVQFIGFFKTGLEAEPIEKIINSIEIK